MNHEEPLELGQNLNKNNTKLMINCNHNLITYIVDTIKHCQYTSESLRFNLDDLCLLKLVDAEIVSRSIPKYIRFSIHFKNIPTESFLEEMEATMNEYKDTEIETIELRNYLLK